MELLQSLIQKLPFFPLSQAAGKLEHLLLNSLDEQDRLLILHLLLVCHRPDVARRELERGPDIATCLTDSPQYVPIHVRAALELGAEPQLPQGPLPPSLPRWVKKYASIGSDLHYPAELTSITLTTKEGVQTVLSFTCPACGGIIATTAQAQWLPIEAEKGEMLCRHCLAKLQWNKSAVRSQVFDYYDRFISSLPRTTEGLLSFENVHSAAMLAVALRPFALIRFVKAFSERIGHFAVDVFVYLRRRLAGLDEPSLDYVSLGSGKVSNATLAELWDRILQFQPFAAQVYDVLRGTEHAYWMFRGGVDPDDGAQRFPLAFPFTAREHEKGLQCLDAMDIPRGSRIACLLVRDGAYMKDLYKTEDSNNIRNFSIDNFRNASKYLAENGYYVLRMGAAVETRLAWADNRIIDYANLYRTEFMDMWLFSYCDLVVTTSTGPDSIRISQGTNYLGVNFFPLPQHLSSTDAHSMLFPHYVWTKNKVRLTLQEVIELDKDSFSRNFDYAPQGVTVLGCTEDEILAAVQEKLYLMQGGRLGEQDMALQQGFKNFYKKNKELFATPSILPNVGSISTYREPLRGFISSVWARQYADELLSYL